MSTLRRLQLCATGAALVFAGLIASVDVVGQAPAAPKVPLLVGLTIVTALNQPDQGDYESIKMFINVNDKQPGPVYRIYHESVHDQNYNREEAIEIVLKSYQHLLKFIDS